MVRTDASGKFEFTDQTAIRTSFRKVSVPARSLRITNVTFRIVSAVGAPKRYFIIGGQYTVGGAFSCTPRSRTSCITPITSCHGIDENSRNCLPTAAVGVPHI